MTEFNTYETEPRPNIPLVDSQLFTEILSEMSHKSFDLTRTVEGIMYNPSYSKPFNTMQLSGELLEAHIDNVLTDIISTNKHFVDITYPFLPPDSQDFYFRRATQGKANVSAYTDRRFNKTRTEYDALMLVPEGTNGGKILGVISARVERGVIPFIGLIDSSSMNKHLEPLTHMIREHPELSLSGIAYAVVSIPDFSSSRHSRIDQFRSWGGKIGTVDISLEKHNNYMEQATRLLMGKRVQKNTRRD